MHKFVKKYKKLILIILFFILNISVILYTGIVDFSDNNNRANLNSITINWYYLIPAISCFIIAILSEIIKNSLIMKYCLSYINWKIMIETVILGKYYDYITPLGFGGQPFQIHYLKQKGLPANTSAAIPLLSFITMQFGFIILGIISFFFGKMIKLDIIRITSYFGLALYASLPIFILLFTFFETTMLKLLSLVVKILYKIKIIKNKQETLTTWSNNIQEYSIAIRYIIHNRKLVILILILSIIYQLATLSIPFFVISAFGGKINYIQCFLTTISIYSTITFIPTPGNSGAAEGSFYTIFSYLTTGYIFWAMMTWRILVYYIYILLGILLYFKKLLYTKHVRK